MNYILSFCIILLTIAFLLLGANLPFDWYLLPVVLGGMISLYKVLNLLKTIDYLRNADFYVWIVLFLGAFVAPLIHFSRDAWISHVYILPSNWNTLALITSAILLYGMFVFIFLEQIKYRPLYQKKEWSFKKNAKYLIIFLMIISFVLQTVYYIRAGGIFGVIQKFTDRDGGFEGMGLYFIVSEMFPYLLLLLYFVICKEKKTSFLNVSIFLAIMFLSALYFGGLRGSRSNTVLTMFQAVLLIHFTIYHFKKRHFIIMVALFFLFMIVGRIYKTHGADFVHNVHEFTDYQINTEMSGIESIIIADLTRYNDLSYLIFMLDNNPFYKPKLGSTYLAAVLTFMPFGIPIRDHFELTARSEAASQLMFDFDGIQRSEIRRNSRIFGFVGEMMLNFGVFSFLFAFFFLHFLLKWVKRWSDSISVQDARFYFISLLPIMVISLINLDSNNVVFFIVKRIVLMYVIIWFITNKTKIKLQ